LTEVITYECGNALETFTLEGSVIGALRPIDKMTTSPILTFKASKGAQVPQSFAEGEADTLSTKIMSGIPPKTETLGTTLAMKPITLTNSTEIETKALEK